MTKSMKAKELANFIVGGKLSEMANYADLFQKTNDAIFLLDIDNHQILECNPSATKFLGREITSGENFLKLASPESLPVLKESLSKIKKDTPKEISFDLHFTNDSVFETTASSLKLKDYCTVIQLIAKDVTIERKASAELVEANKKLAILSTTDEMTKVFNFRHFKTTLALEHARANRHKKPYSIILCDVDHFKNFNDKNGHPEGDKALIKTAAILQARSRNTDVVARYGGEEFVVLCPEVDSAGAMILAEALRKKIADEKYAHGEKQPLGKVTISIGVASFPADGAEADEIIRHADEALYAAKAGGRNKVVTFECGMTKKKAG